MLQRNKKNCFGKCDPVTGFIQDTSAIALPCILLCECLDLGSKIILELNNLHNHAETVCRHHHVKRRTKHPSLHRICLLYTSDAADERSSVDLGGRRIIKKKKLF